MAHFAQLNNENVVIQVIVVDNNEILDNGVESESKGIAFCQSLFGLETQWRQTSYNSNIRKNYAGLGFTYSVELDAFIPPKPFASWTLDTVSCQWQPPIPYPTDGQRYSWNEDTLSWAEQLSEGI